MQDLNKKQSRYSFDLCWSGYLLRNHTKHATEMSWCTIVDESQYIDEIEICNVSTINDYNWLNMVCKI